MFQATALGGGVSFLHEKSAMKDRAWVGGNSSEKWTGGLVDPVFHAADEGGEEGVVAAELGAELEGAFGEFVGLGAGGFEAVEARVGDLFVVDVGVDRLAHGGGVAGDIENVVDHLEGQTDIFANFLCLLDGAGGRGGKADAHGDAGGDEGGGFVVVDEVEPLGGGVAAFADDVLDLTADQFLGAGGVAEIADEPGGDNGMLVVGFGEEPERVGEQGVAREQGHGFVKLLVASGFAAAQIGVVHARQIVVDQAVSVEALQGNGGGQWIERGREKRVGGEAEDGAEAFSSGVETVAHRLVDDRRAGVGRGCPAVQGGLGVGDVFLKLIFEFRGVVGHERQRKFSCSCGYGAAARRGVFSS